MNLTIEVASPADAEALFDLMRQFYAEEGYPFHDRDARKALDGVLEDPSVGRAWLVRDRDQPVGYFVLTLGWSLEYLGRDAFVDEIFVVPSYRRRGLGKRAMEVLAGACRELGVRALHLEVEHGNESARELYRSMGFEDHDRSLMTKSIPRGG